ncbi:hypothetical protein GALMADRAFT_236532 [Galerina marginata CBS 339.88]|uniref:Uncharacterized protein n=1 Tax=Galerina marginata (strain CBS 339.88) TaxID=685588 RepID=A0A067TLB2_GALM3|nr:hypothetical protein GALMADRAFT_236532 [Galerina marginata CBS 339.88]
MKSSNTEPAASTSTKPRRTAKPLSRAANPKPGPSSKPQQQNDEERSQQPSVEELKKLGIKVRDFAYESTLPPLRTIYRHPRQIQPGVPRPLQRQVTEPDQSDSQQSQSNKNVERTPTEPALSPTAPMRMRGFLNLQECDAIDDGDIFDSQQPSFTPEHSIHTQLPPTAPESQESEAGASTSLNTAESLISRNLRNTSDMSASQLNAGPQGVVVPDLFSYLDFSQPIENAQNNRTSSNSQPIALSAQPSPLTPLPSSPHITSSSQPSQSQQSGSINSRSNSTQDLRAPVIPRVIAPRYHLRKRTIPNLPQPPPRPPKRARKLAPPESPAQPSRLNFASAQSSHSPTKNKDKSASSSSRTLRPRAATATGKGKRKRS